MKKLLIAACIASALAGCGSEDVKDKYEELKGKAKETAEEIVDLSKQGWDCKEHRKGDYHAHKHGDNICKLPDTTELHYVGSSLEIKKRPVPAVPPVYMVNSEDDQATYMDLFVAAGAPEELIDTLKHTTKDTQFYIGTYEDGNQAALIMLRQDRTVALIDVTNRTARFLRTTRDESIEWSMDLTVYADLMNYAISQGQRDLFMAHVFDDVPTRDIEGNESVVAKINASFDFGPLFPLLMSAWLYQ